MQTIKAIYRGDHMVELLEDVDWDKGTKLELGIPFSYPFRWVEICSLSGLFSCPQGDGSVS